MTKVRQPLTFESALTTIAGRIGWPDVARICGHAERTVRNWSDPDTTAKMTLEAAFELDLAFRQAGGQDAPFLLCYATRLQAEVVEMSADREKLVAAAAQVAKEAGDALAASLAAARPTATQADFILAEREIEESIVAKTNMLTMIRTLAKQLIRGGSAAAPKEQEQNRVPEVAPSNTI